MSLRWRIIWVGLLVLGLGWAAVANFVPEERRESSEWIPSGMRLGLDLRGGIRMLLAPDLDEAVRLELGHLRNSLERALEDENILVGRLAVVGESTIELELASPGDRDAVRDVVEDYSVLDAEETENGWRLTLGDLQYDQVRRQAVDQSLEVLRRRINDPNTGIQESVVTRQGADRILVEIPGVSEVPDIFARTGFLELDIVLDEEPSEELLQAKYPDGLPEGTRVLVEKDEETGRVTRAYLVNKEPDITGENLSDARPVFDRNEWKVSFTWNGDGAREFGELTEKNRGKNLAIVLDGEVYSAPRIRERISRAGEISGRFSSQQAFDLAVILRAGSLPIPVNLEEERTIGPALGADSIRRGLRASAVGLVLVILFVVLYYRLAGSYAAVALTVNLMLVIGVLSVMRNFATLTLPGIAGLVLTVGMAVDANVLIFERIREELRSGKTVRAAIATGFQKARWTILDANITTLITALILYEFGTGPIQGFAVTLAIGIVTSVFAALVITRMLFMIYPGDRHLEQLSI